MSSLKLNLNLSKLIYKEFCNSVKVGECYNNTFNIMYEFNHSNKYNIEDYKVGYGFLKKIIRGEQVFFRHGFIIYNKDNSIIDVTACLWEKLESKYQNYEYYVFKEYAMEEYLNALRSENGMSALYKISHNEEIELYNYLVKNGYECNPVDYINLFERVYGDGVLEGDKEYSSGKSVLYNPNLELFDSNGQIRIVEKSED